MVILKLLISLLALGVSIIALIQSIKVDKQLDEIVKKTRIDIQESKDLIISFDEFIRDYAPYHDRFILCSRTHFDYLFHDETFGDYSRFVYFISEEDSRRYWEYVVENLLPTEILTSKSH